MQAISRILNDIATRLDAALAAHELREPNLNTLVEYSLRALLLIPRLAHVQSGAIWPLLESIASLRTTTSSNLRSDRSQKILPIPS